MLPLRTRNDKKVSFKERSGKLIDFKEIKTLSQSIKAGGKKVVFTIGSFDLLNPGHCRYLAEAKAMGNVLVVGVATDTSLTRTKGPDYPLVNEAIRAELLSQLKTVDYVTIIDEDRPHALLILLQPDIYFTSKGAWDEGLRDKHEGDLIRSYGGELIIRERHQPYFGTEDLADHIANIRVIQTLQKYLSDKVDGFTLDPEKHLKPADYGDQKPIGENAFNSLDLLIPPEHLKKLGSTIRKKGLKSAFVSGSYDLLHVGHARFIEQAGLCADVLIVGIPSDDSLRKLKGIGRPVISEKSRAYILGHLDPVDHVVIFEEETVLSTLSLLKPDVFFTVEEEWNNYKKSPEYKLVKSYGGKVATARRQAPFTSASAIIDKLAYKKVKEIFRECMDEDRLRMLDGEQTKLRLNNSR